MESNFGLVEAFREKNITAKEMIKLFIYKYGIVHIILLLLIIIELILNIKGYSIYKDILYEGNKVSMDITFWIGIHICLILPFIEELIFRDLILGFLKKFGVKFAIITQALIFAILHNNIFSISHTMVSGILYGYIAIKTNSVLVTTILHIMHNAFATLMGITILKNVDMISPIQIIMAIIYASIALITLYCSNWKIKVGDEMNIDVREILLRYKSSK